MISKKVTITLEIELRSYGDNPIEENLLRNISDEVQAAVSSLEHEITYVDSENNYEFRSVKVDKIQ